jgi:DNA topoisomerase-3
VCAPDATIAVVRRAPTPQEVARLARTLDLLRAQDHQSTGRLCKQVVGEAPADRRAFDALLGGLARAGLVRLADDVFEKDGQRITFQRASLTPRGRADAQALAQVTLVAEAEAPKRERRARKAKSGAATGRTRRRADPVESPLAAALRTWRLGEAKRRRVPAFRIFTDRVLEALCEQRPQSEAALLAVPGVGPKLASSIGPSLLEICRAHRA